MRAMVLLNFSDVVIGIALSVNFEAKLELFDLDRQAVLLWLVEENVEMMHVFLLVAACH